MTERFGSSDSGDRGKAATTDRSPSAPHRDHVNNNQESPIQAESVALSPEPSIRPYKAIVSKALAPPDSGREGFHQQAKPTKFFRIGRIFTVPPDDYDAADHTTQVTASWIYGPHGERYSPRERKLVVVRVGDQSCVVVPITTNEGRGVAKAGVKKSDHAVIHTTEHAPNLLPSEEANRDEMPMRPIPIHAKAKDPTDKLSNAARINFGKPYTIEHNVKVKEWGTVSKHSHQALVFQFVAVIKDEPSYRPGEAAASSDSSTIRPKRIRDEDAAAQRSSRDLKIATESELPEKAVTDTGVATRMFTKPAEAITDPELLARGIGARAMFLGVDPRYYPDFFAQQRPQEFFKAGRVFSILLDESAGYSVGSVSQFEFSSAIGQDGLPRSCKMRRFVVVNERTEYCSVLPIITYDGQGVAKAGVVKEEHGIIYTGSHPPAKLESETPKREEPPMQPNALRVLPDRLDDKLDPKSRIHYKRVYTVKHNVPVKSFGKLASDSVRIMMDQFGNVWENRDHETAEDDTIRAAPDAVSSNLPRSLVGLASSSRLEVDRG